MGPHRDFLGRGIPFERGQVLTSPSTVGPPTRLDSTRLWEGDSSQSGWTTPPRPPAHIGASIVHRRIDPDPKLVFVFVLRCSPDVCPEACSRRAPRASSHPPRPHPPIAARRRASRRATPPRCSRGKKKTRTARRRARFYVTAAPRARRLRIWGYPRRTKPR